MGCVTFLPGCPPPQTAASSMSKRKAVQEPPDTEHAFRERRGVSEGGHVRRLDLGNGATIAAGAAVSRRTRQERRRWRSATAILRDVMTRGSRAEGARQRQRPQRRVTCTASRNRTICVWRKQRIGHRHANSASVDPGKGLLWLTDRCLFLFQIIRARTCEM